MLHLNDSRSECGSRLDRHEHVGAGRIGERGLSPSAPHPGSAARPWYVETPGMDVGYDPINVTRARSLAAGEPLDPLPPEAFELRAAGPPRPTPSQSDGAGEDEARTTRIDLLGLAPSPSLVGLVLAARLPPGQGEWDADQGHDLLVLAAFVRQRRPAAGPADLDR